MAKFETLNVQGFREAIGGMRAPLKSYDKYDTTIDDTWGKVTIGPNDYKLMKSLGKGGTEHRKYLRQIGVWADIWLPRFVGSEWDTYKIGTAANSESTMHKILQEDFNESNFEGMFENSDGDIEAEFNHYLDLLKTVRDRANSVSGEEKEHYQQLLKCMLPESFIQKRTVNLNYETLATMYRQRKNHRLPQGREDFTEWVHTLPYHEFITGEGANECSN